MPLRLDLKPRTSRVLLEIDGAVCAEFQKALRSNVSGRGAITLQRGVCTKPDLLACGAHPKRIALITLDATGAEKARESLRNAHVVKRTGPTLNAKGNDVGIETLEIVHEGIENEG